MSLSLVHKCGEDGLVTQDLQVIIRRGRPYEIQSKVVAVKNEVVYLRQTDNFRYGTNHSDPQEEVLTMACALWGATLMKLRKGAQISSSLINLKNNQVIVADAANFDEIEFAIRSHWNMGPLEQRLAQTIPHRRAQAIPPPSSLSSKLCASCGKPADCYCANCRIVCYCSKDCQKNDWRTHRQICKS